MSGKIGTPDDTAFYVAPCIVTSSASSQVGAAIQVPVYSVADIEKQYGFEFDTVFMDIQGGEYEFIRDNRSLLSKCGVIVLEFHPHVIGPANCEDARRVMAEAGLERIEVVGDTEVWQRAGRGTKLSN